MKPSLDTFLKNLKSKGHRLTKVRRALLEMFTQSSLPVSATELISYLQKIHINVNKTTVYRELSFLLQTNVIHEIHLHEGKKRYEVTSLDHHHHITCIQCGSIQDIDLPQDFDRLEEKVKRKKHFKILRHSLEFFGMCSKCTG